MGTDFAVIPQEWCQAPTVLPREWYLLCKFKTSVQHNKYASSWLLMFLLHYLLHAYYFTDVTILLESDYSAEWSLLSVESTKWLKHKKAFWGQRWILWRQAASLANGRTELQQTISICYTWHDETGTAVTRGLPKHEAQTTICWHVLTVQFFYVGTMTWINVICVVDCCRLVSVTCNGHVWCYVRYINTKYTVWKPWNVSWQQPICSKYRLQTNCQHRGSLIACMNIQK